jgi:hypothetical protein
MASWTAWGILVAVTVVLLVISGHFSVRMLRWVAAVITIGLVLAITAYGVSQASVPGSSSSHQGLESALPRGADAVVASLFPVLRTGREAPGLGLVGGAVIVAVILFAYRQLEVRAYSRQAPVLDISRLGEGQASAPAPGTSNDPNAVADGSGTLTDDRRCALLIEELKFRLTSIEVRSPPILPGGSRPDPVAALAEDRGIAGGNSRTDGLAAIVDHSGVAGSPLVGAIIRFFGLLWPSPRRWQLRVRLEVPASADGVGAVVVTVSLVNPEAGVTVATKTIAAGDLEEAASMVAGYVTRQVFARDPATPSWCYGASDGRDLGALLMARLEPVLADSWETVRRQGQRTVELLQMVATQRCAGVVRYELAQLHHLGRNHLTALRLHAENREEDPRFLRNRYRLAMSLEMVANPALTDTNPSAMIFMLTEILAVLHRCGLTASSSCSVHGVVASEDSGGAYRVSGALSVELLDAARAELRVIRRQFRLPAVLWAWLIHRDERAVWRPYWRLGARQAFQDGVCVAELLVAVRTQLADPTRQVKRPQYRRALRVAAAITGDSVPIELLLWMRPQPGSLLPAKPDQAYRTLRPPTRDRARLLPWSRQTGSWLAAYNTACIYAALAQHGHTGEDRVAASLRRAVRNRDTEIERSYDWIAHDPDFQSLKNSSAYMYPDFKRYLRDQKRRDYPRRPVRTFDLDNED